MRDPLARKLFQSHDAREKLRGMGGIMASSPELAQTVAKFNLGGDIDVDRQRQGYLIFLQQMGLLDSPESREMYARMMQRQAERPLAPELFMPRMAEIPQGLSPAGIETGVRVPGTEVAGPSMPPPSGLGPAPNVDPIGFDPSILELPPRQPQQPPRSPESGFGTLARITGEAADVARGMGLPIPNINLPQVPNLFLGASGAGAPMDGGVGAFEYGGLQNVSGDQDLSLERVMDDLGFGAAMEPVRRRRAQAPTPVAEEDEDEDEMSRLAREDAARIAAQREAAGVTDARGSFGALFTEGDEEGAAAVIERARKEFAPTAPAVDDDEEYRGAPLPPPGGSIDFDTTYEQMLGRLQNVMGEGTKKSDREKAMANLAMIGLAIAAGQSPDALTNIAQGALMGMQGIKQAEAAERAQEQEMRLAALKMAQEEVALGRRLQSAEKIAAMRAGSDAESQRQEYLYNDVFRQMLEQARQETEDDMVAVNRAAAAAAAAAPNAPSAIRWRMSQGLPAGGGGSGTSAELLTPEERELLGL